MPHGEAAAAALLAAGGDGLRLEHVLTALNTPVSEQQLWALCHQCVCALQTLSRNNELPSVSSAEDARFLVTLQTSVLQRDGSICFDRAVSLDALGEVQPYVPPEVQEGAIYVVKEKVQVFSLGVTLFKAADYMLEEDEEPTLTEDFEALMTTMLDEDVEDRCDLADVQDACKDHIKGDTTAFPQLLGDLYSLASSIIEPEPAPAAEDVKEMRRASTASLPAAATTDLHANLMEALRSPVRLKDVGERKLTGPLREATPHERLMEQIKNGSPLRPTPSPQPPRDSSSSLSLAADAASAPGAPTPSTAEHAGDVVVVGANGKSQKKLSVNLSAMSDILGGWDPATQVQMAFATEAAASPTKKSPGDGRRDAVFAEQGAPPAVPSGDKGPASGGPSVPRKTPVKLSPQKEPDPAPPPAFMNFEELRHIRSVSAFVEMEDLLDDNPKLHDSLKRGKVCGACQATKFNLLTRSKDCGLCGRHVCSKCSGNIQLPPHMTRDSPKATRKFDLDKPIVICNGCRSCLGGVNLATTGSPARPQQPEV